MMLQHQKVLPLQRCRDNTLTTTLYMTSIWLNADPLNIKWWKCEARRAGHVLSDDDLRYDTRCPSWVNPTVSTWPVCSPRELSSWPLVITSGLSNRWWLSSLSHSAGAVNHRCSLIATYGYLSKLVVLSTLWLEMNRAISVSCAHRVIVLTQERLNSISIWYQ